GHPSHKGRRIMVPVRAAFFPDHGEPVLGGQRPDEDTGSAEDLVQGIAKGRRGRPGLRDVRLQAEGSELAAKPVAVGPLGESPERDGPAHVKVGLDHLGSPVRMGEGQAARKSPRPRAWAIQAWTAGSPAREGATATRSRTARSANSSGKREA